MANWSVTHSGTFCLHTATWSPLRMPSEIKAPAHRSTASPNPA